MIIRNMQELGARIADRRRELGWSQTDLADRAGVSRQWVSLAERGKPAVEFELLLRTIDVLGLALNVARQNPDRPVESPSVGGELQAPSPTSAGARTATAPPRPPLTRGGRPLHTPRRDPRHGDGEDR